MCELAADPVFADPEWHDISRDEVRVIYTLCVWMCVCVCVSVCGLAGFKGQARGMLVGCAIREHSIHPLNTQQSPPHNKPITHPIQVRERTIKKLRAAYKLLIVDGSDVARRNARLEIHALQDLGMKYI